jgi:hypothetical protein
MIKGYVASGFSRKNEASSRRLRWMTRMLELRLANLVAPKARPVCSAMAIDG